MLAVVPAYAGTTASMPAVQTAILQPTTWRVTAQIPATLDAQRNAVLAAERAGQVVAVLYISGETVAAGTLLVKLNDAPEQAQLALDQARLSESQRALARNAKLLQIAGASQAQFEQAQADMAEAKAQVMLDNAMLAQLNITAPFAGITGIRKISEGDYIQQGQPVAQLTQIGPLRVLFSVPQTEAGDLNPGDNFVLTVASLPAGADSFQGKITALSPQLDTTTNARAVEGGDYRASECAAAGHVRGGDPADRRPAAGFHPAGDRTQRRYAGALCLCARCRCQWRLYRPCRLRNGIRASRRYCGDRG